MTEPTLVAQSETFNILQLPQDVQLSILLAFNIRELVICKRMCRSLANLIDDDICIRYKIELARSGRIDGAPSVTVTVADRLTSLREHRARFHAGDHPLKRVREQPFGSLAALSSNGFVTTIAGGSVHLWRPSSTFSGIRQQKIGRSMRDLDLEGVNTGSCVADVSQDLLVFSRKDPDAIPLDCFIYSLSKGRPHPSASQCHISSSLGSEIWADSPALDSIQVLGDLIAWNVPNLNGRHCEMRVINWKTGVTVWEFHNEFWWRCRLVSQSHVVVVTFESLLVYPINLHLKGPSAPSTSDTALCILQLPAWSSIGFSRSLLVKSYIQFPPPLSPNDRPLYRHDPNLTLLTLYIRYIVDIPDHERRLDQYAMFIPISTINTRVEVSTPSPSPPGGSPHVVQWNDWGPTGTHIARFDLESPCHFSPMGCSCAVAQRRRDPGSGNLFLRVLVFDVHPWARPDPQHVKEASGLVHATEPDTLLAGPAFTETIRTTFPFDVTRRDIPLTRDDRYPVVVLTEDGLLLVTSPVDIP